MICQPAPPPRPQPTNATDQKGPTMPPTTTPPMPDLTARREPGRPAMRSDTNFAEAPQNDAKTSQFDGYFASKTAFRLRQVEEDAPSQLALFRRVLTHKTGSRRDAIKAFCLECVWMDKKAIRECTATACPLWHFRPYQGRADTRKGVEQRHTCCGTEAPIKALEASRANTRLTTKKG